MTRVDELGVLNRVGKRLAPTLASIAANRAGARALGLLEAYLAVLQGKGSGSGWDLEAEITVAAQTIQRAQPVIVDVGANRGAWSEGLFRRIAPLDPRFYLLEPSTSLQSTLSALSIPNKILLPVALGDRVGEATLHSDAPGSEAASLHERRDTYHQGGEAASQQVTVTTLDALATQQKLTQIDYLKIDVEGHELAVLQGAQASLRSGMVHALAFEFGSGQINSRTYFHDFWDLLHPLNFRLYRILPGGRITPVERYYESLEYFRGVSNYLALRPATFAP